MDVAKSATTGVVSRDVSLAGDTVARRPRRKESGANRRRFALHISRGIVSPRATGEKDTTVSAGGIRESNKADV